MEKIRILIAHDNRKTRDEIEKSINKFEFVEIVGITAEGNETYNKIIELKPEMIFIQYNFKDIKGLDLAKKIKDKLQEQCPVINTIDEIPDEELIGVTKIVGEKLNACVRIPYNNSITKIIKEYIYNKNK